MLTIMLEWTRRLARRLLPQENALYREVREAREAYANVKKARKSIQDRHVRGSSTSVGKVCLVVPHLFLGILSWPKTARDLSAARRPSFDQAPHGCKVMTGVLDQNPRSCHSVIVADVEGRSERMGQSSFMDVTFSATE